MNEKSKSARSKNSGFWISGAINPKHKDLLHKELGVPADKPIPVAKERAAARGNSATAKRARLALTLRKLG